jgi:hypothetical protein
MELTDGRPIWIRLYRGGLVHALSVPGVRTVESAAMLRFVLTSLANELVVRASTGPPPL